MAERNATYGIQLNANGDGLVGAVDKGAEATKKLTESMAALKNAARGAGEETEAFTQRVRQMRDDLHRAEREAHAAAVAKNILSDSERKQAEIVNFSRQAQVALTNEVRTGIDALKSNVGELTALVAAQGAARAGMAGLAGMFTGPAGIVALLGAAALSWVNFGNTAEEAGRKAEEAGRKTQAALQLTERERARARQAELALEIQGFAAKLQDINRPGRALTPDDHRDLAQDRLGIQYAIASRTAEIQRLGQAWPEPGPSIADATRGLKTPSGAQREYEERIASLRATYGAAIEGAGTPEYISRMQRELAEYEAAARRQYDAQLKSFAPPKGGGITLNLAGGGGFDDGSAMLLGLKNQLAAVSGETSTYDSVLRRITEGTKEFSGEVRAEALALAASIDQRREVNEETKRNLASRADESKAIAVGIQQGWKEIEVLRDGNARLTEHNQAIGRTTAETTALSAAREEARLALAEQSLAEAAGRDGSEQELALLRANVEALKERVRLLREGAVGEAATDSAKKAEEEWKRASTNIERALTDSIIRGFDGGKSFLRNFIDSLVNGFKTAVLQPIIAPIVRPFAQSVAGAVGGLAGLGGSGSAQAGGFGGFGIPSPSSFLNIGGALEFASGLASGLGSGAATTAALIESGTVGFAGAGLEAAAGIGGFSSVLGPIGLGVAALSLMGAFDEGGGPKEQTVWWRHGGGNNLGIGDENITSQDPAYYAAAAEATRRLHAEYGAEALAAVPTMSVQGAAGSDPHALLDRMVQQITSALGPAAQQKKAAEQAKNNAALAQLQSLGLVESSLKGWVDGQAVSEYLSPEDRLAGARGLFDDALAGAGAGDMDAARALPGLADQLIGAGPGVYASSTKFQDLRGEVAGELAKVLEQQGVRQADILAEMPAAVLQAGSDTVAAINKLRSELLEELRTLASSVRQGLAPA